MSGSFKVFLISAAFFTLLSYCGAIAQWEIEQSGVTVTLRDVHFADKNYGWAVGDSSTIITTSDGGETWQRQNSPIDTVIFEKVFFVNRNVGYIVGRTGIILSTQDGGINWVLNESGVNYSLFSLSFVNRDTGWVVGGDLFQTRRKGVILYTEDAGQTWEKQLETYSPSVFSSRLFSAVSFIDAENGWAFASDYVDNFSLTYVYRTTNGGKEWNVVSVADAPLWEMSMASSDTIWGGGFVFAKSNDGGLNWHYTGGNLDFGVVWDVQALDGKKGWVGARSLLFTEDGMRTWTDLLPERRFPLRAITNIGEDYLWAVGDSGVVIKYTSGSTKVDDEDEPEIPDKLILHQNFPNPFNSGTVINFELNSIQKVTLTIYDVKGRQISVLISETLNPGIYSVSWDGKDALNRQVSSGIYFYELQAEDLTIAKKAMVVR